MSSQERKIAIVGIEGILWNKPDLLVSLHNRMTDTSKSRVPMISTKSFAPHSSKGRILKDVAGGLSGRRVDRLNNLMNGIAEAHTRRLNPEVIDRLACISASGYILIAMSSGPDMLVASAVDSVNQITGLRFSSAILASRFDVSTNDGEPKYTGNFEMLNKNIQIGAMLQRLGNVSVLGVINGDSDLLWANTNCEFIEPISPGPKLLAYLQERGLPTDHQYSNPTWSNDL
jgi:hypothetical protein